MFYVKSSPIELRGVENKVKKDGSVYYVLRVEGENGVPYQLYCPKPDALPDGLKKGNMITVTFGYTVYDRSERLFVSKVEKVG